MKATESADAAPRQGRRAAGLIRKHATLWLFVGAILVPLSIAVLAARSYLIGTLPQTAGSVRIAGVHAPVTLTRDERGVLHIRASDDADVFFAMGYAHAQDRMWQLEVQRRMARGELAEVFGKDAVNFDVYVRTLGLFRNAASSWNSLNASAKASLSAYAAGINAWLAEGHRLPVEFALLGVKPRRWEPADSLAWIKVFALNLSGNYRQDLNRFTASQVLKPVQYAALFGESPPAPPLALATGGPPRLRGLGALVDLADEVDSTWRVASRNVGSNAWVVSGKWSAKGVATLANDPHLELDMPSLWYVVDLQGDHLHASGMSLVGLPIVMIGHNQHVGWGVTNMMADTMDLYFEDINTGNLNQYRRGNTWREFDSHVESIAVKADFPSFLREPLAPVEITIRRTDVGPVLSDVIRNAGQPLSLRWTGDSREDTTYQAFLALNYANDWTSVKQAMSEAIAPALNLLYVDDQQNIGYLGVGRIPLRGAGNGSIPVPAWDERFAWRGFIPAREMPQSYNPPSGYIVSANNPMMEPGYPYFISQDWADPQRAERIAQLIQRKIERTEPVTVADHEAIQQDVNDAQAGKVLAAIVNLQTDEPELQEMLGYLKAWRGEAGEDSVGAAIFFSWMRHLRGALFNDKLQVSWGQPWLQHRLDAISAEVPLPRVLAALQSRDFDWCDQRDTPEKETCRDVEIDALRDAHTELQKRFGSDISQWRWGRVQHAIFRHRPFSDVRGLDVLFERRTGRGGSPNSVNLSQFRFDEKDGYVQAVGPGFREIVQFVNGAPRLLFMNSTGQSGNLVSHHYDDMVKDFSEGRYEQLTLVGPKGPTGSKGQSTLQLLPAVNGAGNLGARP